MRDEIFITTKIWHKHESEQWANFEKGVIEHIEKM